MNKEYVQQYVELEKKHWWFITRQKIILRFIKDHRDAAALKILNIGAAGGASTAWLSSLGEVVSTETDPAFIEHLSRQHIDVVESSVIQLPFDAESFDLVCAFDVIEHVEDDTRAMQEMTRVCRRGGMICVTVPAFKLLWSSHDVVNGHYRRYDKKSLSLLSRSAAGLRCIDMFYFNSLLFLPILLIRKLSRVFRSKTPVRQSDFSLYRFPSLLNKSFGAVFSLEATLLRFMRFPFGVSLIGAWKKEV